jgi:hypothetical protein
VQRIRGSGISLAWTGSHLGAIDPGPGRIAVDRDGLLSCDGLSVAAVGGRAWMTHHRQLRGNRTPHPRAHPSEADRSRPRRLPRTVSFSLTFGEPPPSKTASLRKPQRAREQVSPGRGPLR